MISCVSPGLTFLMTNSRREGPIATYTICFTAWHLQRLCFDRSPCIRKLAPCTRKHHFLVLWLTSSDTCVSATCCLTRLFSRSPRGIHWWASPRLWNLSPWRQIKFGECVTGNQLIRALDLAYVTKRDKSSLLSDFFGEPMTGTVYNLTHVGVWNEGPETSFYLGCLISPSFCMSNYWTELQHPGH